MTKKFFGIPYDWREPTVARFKSRWWNAKDPRLFTPRAYGAGWDFNVYWIMHLPEYKKNKSNKSGAGKSR